ncbi:MAG: Rrf2 family transcriptional regulator [Spirochaetes bacterium]|nr:Rrf2 family transcriptional regulator [Spirochaetota bacterium]
MRISTKIRYSVRALLYLAVNEEGKPLQIRDIAKHEKLSVRYLENLFTNLRASGILSSVKGKGGGFMLNKPSEKINLLEVIKAVEGNISIVGCIGSDAFCRNSSDCITKDIWNNANTYLKDFFRSITLKDMMEDHKKRIKKKK